MTILSPSVTRMRVTSSVFSHLNRLTVGNVFRMCNISGVDFAVDCDEAARLVEAALGLFSVSSFLKNVHVQLILHCHSS